MLLITGCPRSGTAYTAELINQLAGVGTADHEKAATRCPVLVDWHGVVRMYDGPIIHLIRDPLKTVSSMLTVQKSSMLFAAHHVPELKYTDDMTLHDTIKFMSVWWLRWTQRCLRMADESMRVEDITAPVYLQRLKKHVPQLRCNNKLASLIRTDINWRGHRSLHWENIRAVLTDEQFDQMWEIVKQFEYV